MPKKTTTLKAINHQGKPVDEVSISSDLVSVTASPILMARAVRAYLDNQRQGSKATQDRADVSYSTRKLYRQKGTGRARHGSRRAHIFVGGAVAHGPTGQENYTKKLPVKMRRKALLAAFSQHFSNQTLTAITNIEKLDPKTKATQPLLSALNQPRSLLVVLAKPYPNVIQAMANLPHTTVTQASRLNVYELLKHQVVVLDQAAEAVMVETYLKETSL